MSNKEPMNSADRKANEKAKKQEAFGAKQAKLDIQNSMAHPFVQRMMWRIIADTGIFRSSFTGNSTTFFQEGERNVGLKLMTKLEEAVPGIVGKMSMENLAAELGVQIDTNQQEEKSDG